LGLGLGSTKKAKAVRQLNTKHRNRKRKPHKNPGVLKLPATSGHVRRLFLFPVFCFLPRAPPFAPLHLRALLCLLPSFAPFPSCTLLYYYYLLGVIPTLRRGHVMHTGTVLANVPGNACFYLLSNLPKAVPSCCHCQFACPPLPAFVLYDQQCLQETAVEVPPPPKNQNCLTAKNIRLRQKAAKVVWLRGITPRSWSCQALQSKSSRRRKHMC
jgi:hypothetical protein